jgi:integrase
MKPVRSGDHLEQIGETWFYRRVVPKDARDAFGKYQVRFSLGTKSQTEAKRLEKIHDVEFEAKLKAARETAPDGFPRHPGLRTGALIAQVIEDGEDSESVLTKIPVGDREQVMRGIEQINESIEEHATQIDQFWEEHLRDLLTDVYYDEDPDAWHATCEDLIERAKNYQERMSDHTIDWGYKKWLEAAERPSQTEKDGRRYIDEFKKSAKVRTLVAVRRRHITDWRTDLQKAGNLGTKSINHCLEILSAILRHGWREAEISDVPDLRRVNLPEPVTSGRTSWTRDELLKALGALEPGSWSAWVFVIALTTGTRLGEPVAARREWYDPMGCILVPAEHTKMKKPHVMPIVELIREPLVKHIAKVKAGAFMFDAPRPAKATLKVSHEASKWFSRFFHRKDIQIDKVFHELRHTWVEAARISPIKKEVHDIISGHAGTTVSDRYGGAKPSELMEANEVVCRQFLDPEMTTAVKRLVS